MYKKFAISLLLVLFVLKSSQGQTAYQDGEWFKFRIHYGLFNASFATLQLNETSLAGKPVYHITGKGKSTGLLHLFFKVDDTYQTFIDKQDSRPYKFLRKINEGGHTKNLIINFDHQDNKARVYDKKHDTRKTYTTKENIHDMLSSFYYLRNQIKPEKLTPGEEFHLNLFLDGENIDFKVRFVEREIIKTKFGKVKALKFKPYVLAGRVFKEKESLTFWVSDDENKIPLKIKADLAVGSLDADLEAYKGLKHPFTIIQE
ncbi:DUF3108 domain-containing protein [Zunongwangia sp.]|uniref:DUF3108 domain-containing protein n=1 Tax=Zunongwangia sp. TaxID=1965325 RepID=UPI003AA97317